MGVTSIKREVGSPVPFEHQVEWEYSRAGGSQPTYTFEGPYQKCREKYSALIATDPVSMSLRRVGDSPDYKLTANYAFDPANPGDTESNPPINTFEVEDNQLQQHTAQSLYLHTQLGSSSVAISIVDIHDRWKAKKIEYAQALTEASSKGGTPDQKSACETYLGELARGVDSFLNFHTVFRRSITIVHPGQIDWAVTGVKQIWSTAQVAEFEGPPTEIAALMPAGYWYKLPPRALAAANQRTQLTWEYWCADEWSALYYKPHAPGDWASP